MKTKCFEINFMLPYFCTKSAITKSLEVVRMLRNKGVIKYTCSQGKFPKLIEIDKAKSLKPFLWEQEPWRPGKEDSWLAVFFWQELELRQARE